MINLSKENEMMTEMVADLWLKLEEKDVATLKLQDENKKYQEMIQNAKIKISKYETRL